MPAGALCAGGKRLLECADESNPCRQAYLKTLTEWGLKPEDGRCSWDPVVTLLAVRGVNGVYGHKAGRGGMNRVYRNGTNEWVPDPKRLHPLHSYLALNSNDPYYKGPIRALEKEIDRLICVGPAK